MYRAGSPPDPAGDLYSLGATLHYALTGMNPVVIDPDHAVNRDPRPPRHPGPAPGPEPGPEPGSAPGLGPGSVARPPGRRHGPHRAR
ncbi:hypothetical protein [Streptomyces sp.]|uniref:hypothetical protein n=1 Tax=Streptomyces sp. TaxID=1931 RepID=UPI002F3F6F21